MTVKSFKDLIVWQKAFELSAQVYILTEKLPDSEKFALSSQLQRSSVSIVSNIAEGYGRNNRAEYLHFLGIARGSAFELEAQLMLLEKIYKIDAKKVLDLLVEVQKILYAFSKKLNA